VRIIFDVLRDGLDAIQTANRQLAQAQQQMATGKRVAGAGDDPVAVQQAIGERATLGALDAYKRTNQSAASILATADAVLSGMSDKLTEATVAGLSARGEHVNAAARSAAAERVRSLRASLVGDINTRANGVSLFAGTAADQPAYALAGGGWTYQGDTGITGVEVELGRTVAVTFNGRQIAQGADATDVFTVLDDLATAIEAGDGTGIDAGLAALDRAFARTQQAIGALGADQRSSEEASIRLASMRQAANVRRAALEDADLAESTIRLTQAETAYRAALGAVSTAERQSLLDYLR
jgi:flagellar hook-associated protein 3 FlgL